MKKVLHKFKVLLLSGHTEFSELFLGFLGVLWGIWGFIFGSPVPSSIIHTALGNIIWSFILLFVGVYTVISAIYGSNKLRKFSTFFNIVIWGSISFMFFIDSATVIFWATYGLLFLFSILLNIRTKFRGIERYEPIK